MAAPDNRPAMKRVPLPKGGRYRLKRVGYNPTTPNVLSEVLGYGLLFVALIAILILTYSVLPALLTLRGSPLRVGGLFNTAGILVYGVLAAALSFGVVAVAALILISGAAQIFSEGPKPPRPAAQRPRRRVSDRRRRGQAFGQGGLCTGSSGRPRLHLSPHDGFVSAFLLLAIVPFAPTWVLANLNVGLLFIIAAGTLGAYGVLVAGWSINNKFGLLGGLRGAAQLISYEIPLSISLLSVAVWVGSLNLLTIIESQRIWWTAVPLFISAAVYLVASLAEIKMTPFDLPEAESELVAGFHTEYSGMRFGFFFVAEFGELFLLPAIAVVLFFGGYLQPLAGVWDFAAVLRGWGAFGVFLASVYGMLWFLLKTAVLAWLIMWVRATLPRFRDDQLMEGCWKVLIPLSLVGLVVAVVLRLVFK